MQVGLYIPRVGSQLLRRHETFSISYHATTILLPPTVVAFYNTPGESADAPSILWCYIAYFASLIAWTLLYRVSPLHPLSRYPGPFWCKTSKLWWAFLTLQGYTHYRLRALHERYGDVVRIGPNELSIRNPDAIGPLLGVSGVPKSPGVVGQLLASGQRAEDISMIGLVDVDEHLHRRRPWNRAFGSSAVKEYEPMIAKRTEQLLDALARQKGVVSLGKWLNYFSYDFMCDMTFGGGSELMRVGDAHNSVWAMIDNGMILTNFFIHIPWLGPYVGCIPGAAGPLSTLMAHARRSAAARIDRGSSTRDLFYYLNNEDLPDKPPPPQKQLVDDSILAIIAGADTTSSAVLSAIFCLATHPEVYSKLQQEVDTFYTVGEDVLAMPGLQEMYYLNAVLNETLRLYPPVPGGGQRKVPCGASEVVVGELVIPPGTSFWMPVYSLHRDARHFVHPDTFWPDRWLIASGRIPLSDALSPKTTPSGSPFSPTRSPGEIMFTHNVAAFVPFSHGPMNCAGRHLALLEMRMVLCALLRRFRFRLAEGWDVGRYDSEFKDYSVAARPELLILLEAR